MTTIESLTIANIFLRHDSFLKNHIIEKTTPITNVEKTILEKAKGMFDEL